MRPTTPLLFAALASGLAAQTRYTVSPGVYAAAEANTSTNYPFGYINPAACLQVHDDLRGKVLLVKEIAFRRDGVLPAAYAAYSVDLTLGFSSAATTCRTIATAFASNHGLDLKTVLARATVGFPATTAGTAPSPFTFVVPFAAAPFLYPGQASLCWEIRVHTTTYPGSPGPSFDCPSGVIRGVGTALGARTCMSSDQTAPANINTSYIEDNKTTPPSYKHTVTASYLGKSQPYVWMIGASAAMWAGLPLPFDLGPLGRPNCKIYVAPIATLGGTTGTTGVATTAPVPFPADPAVEGLPVYDQLFSLDPPSALPLVFTDAQVVRVPQVVASRVIVTGAGADTAVSGNFQDGVAAVTRFGHP